MMVWQSEDPLLLSMMDDRSTKPECSHSGSILRHIISKSFPLNTNPFSNHNSFLFQHINCQIIIIYLRIGLMHIHDIIRKAFEFEVTDMY